MAARRKKDVRRTGKPGPKPGEKARLLGRIEDLEQKFEQIDTLGTALQTEMKAYVDRRIGDDYRTIFRKVAQNIFTEFVASGQDSENAWSRAVTAAGIFVQKIRALDDQEARAIADAEQARLDNEDRKNGTATVETTPVQLPAETKTEAPASEA